MAKQIIAPHPGHPITIEPAQGRVIVRAGGKVVAESDNALVLQEASYPPVYYIPRADAAPALEVPTATSTYCPYKGDASYFSIGGRDAVWSYETPHPAMARIAGHLAFYPDRVDSIELIAG